MNKTKIEWTDYTWNPVTGCNKVSQGCKFCYAEQMANRFWGDRKFTDVQIHKERLDEPFNMGDKLHGKKVFVCDVSDLFHKDVPFLFIYEVFMTMWKCQNTTFQLVTKRPDRAIEFYKYAEIDTPLPNVWFLVSVEDQPSADERIPLLLQIPAVVHGLSCEPLLGPIDLNKIQFRGGSHIATPGAIGSNDNLVFQIDALSDVFYNHHFNWHNKKINWVIAGGESGHRIGVRPMHPNWVRSLRDQCKAANVAFFFKQWGKYNYIEKFPFPVDHLINAKHYWNDTHFERITGKETANILSKWPIAVKAGKSKAGNVLDGKQHLEYPQPK